METVKVTYVWTKEELRRALRAQSRSALRPSLLLFTRCFAFLLGALTIFLVFLPAAGAPFDPLLYVFILFCIYWTFFAGRGFAWMWLLGFEKSPFANKAVEWEISKQQITQQCEDLSAAQFSWKIVDRIIASSEGFLFYVRSGKTFYRFPYEAFETPQCIEKVKEFARSNAIKIIEAKR